jgi:hypothetical protein
MFTKSFLFIAWSFCVFGSNHFDESLISNLKKNINLFYSPTKIRISSFDVSFSNLKKNQKNAKKFLNLLSSLCPEGSNDSFSKDLVMAILLYNFPFDSVTNQTKEKVDINKISANIITCLEKIITELTKIAKEEPLDDSKLFKLQKHSSSLLLNLKNFSVIIKKLNSTEQQDYVEQVLISYKKLSDYSSRTYFTGFSTSEQYDEQQEHLIAMERDILKFGLDEQKGFIALAPLRRIFLSNQGPATFHNKLHSKFADKRTIIGTSFSQKELSHAVHYIKSVASRAKGKSELFAILLYLKEMLTKIKPIKKQTQYLIEYILSEKTLLEIALLGKDYNSVVPVLFCVDKLESWGSLSIREKVTKAYDKADALENIICILVEEILMLGSQFQDFVISSYRSDDSIEYEKSVVKERLQNFEINFEIIIPEIEKYIKENSQERSDYSTVCSDKFSESFMINYLINILTDENLEDYVDDTIFRDSKKYLIKLSDELDSHIQQNKFLVSVEILLIKERG